LAQACTSPIPVAVIVYMALKIGFGLLWGADERVK
jgi:hypothetical protein